VKDTTLYLLHIVECIGKIERYAEMGRAGLADDALIFDAVLRNLQTLSEATQRLPQDLRERHPGIPWKRIAGFRNILVHDYLGGIDPPVVWTIMRTELPILNGAILTELSDRPSVRQATISDSAEPDTP